VEKAQYQNFVTPHSHGEMAKAKEPKKMLTQKEEYCLFYFMLLTIIQYIKYAVYFEIQN
jgi:hypothetical protein